MKITMQLDGVPDLLKLLNGKRSRIEYVSSTNVLASCKRITRDAKRGAPVATGLLRGSITYATRKTAWGHAGGIGIAAGSRANVYWRFPEFGTKSYAAHPYFRPAAEAERAKFAAEMRAKVRQVVVEEG